MTCNKLGENSLAAAGTFFSTKIRALVDLDSIYMDLCRFVCIFLRFPYISMVLHGFIWIFIDLEGISMISGLGGRAPNGNLWRAVAACCGPRQKAVAPIEYHTQSLGLADWQDGGWLAGWQDSWLDGWLL